MSQYLGQFTTESQQNAKFIKVVSYTPGTPRKVKSKSALPKRDTTQQ